MSNTEKRELYVKAYNELKAETLTDCVTFSITDEKLRFLKAR